MKKLAAIILCIATVLAFSGCGENSPASEPVPAVTSPGTVGQEAEAPGADPIIESDYPGLSDEIEGQNRRISVLCAGDNVIHPALYMEAKNRAKAETRNYNFLPMYADISDMVKEADISFINQETLMAGDEKYGLSGYPLFNSPQDLAYELIDLGFDIINMANNHMLDQGASGLKDTIDYYDTLKDDILMVGGYRNEEDYDTLRFYDHEGFRIAVLSYTYGTNGLILPYGSELVVPYLDEDTVRRQVKNAKESADLVFVSVHWGTENLFSVTDEQKEYASIMAESGADVIIGHHPHVIQPIEWIDRGDGKRTLCIYSLGNLVSEMALSMNMIGCLVTFDIVVENGGDPFIDNVSFIPTVFHYGLNYFGTHLYLMEDYTEELAAKHGTRIYGSGYAHTYKLKDMQDVVRKEISEEFLPDFLKN